MIREMVSVIVPVYNAQEYLGECIRSVCRQTYSNLELILVDDGSTDGSSTIYRRMAVQDERIHIVFQKNKGAAAARNVGIRKARGEYILFVDSDDTIEPNMIEVLYEAIVEKNADISCCGLLHVYEDHQRKFPPKPVLLETDGLGAVGEVLKNHIATAGPVCKLFHRNCVTETMFPEDLRIGEGALAVAETFLKVRRVVFVTQPLYRYHHREDSLMSAAFSKRDMDLIEAYQRISRLIQGKDLEKEAMFRQIWSHFYVYDKMIRSHQVGAPEEKELVHWLRHRAFCAFRNPYVGKMRKVALCALLINKKLYQWIIRRVF